MAPQVVLTTRITPGLDGVRKQSKTLGNFVAIDDDARTKFGKAMTLPDRLVPDWMEVYTTLPPDAIARWRGALAEGANPRDAKLALATALVERWHGAETAAAEREWFERSFSRREVPPDAPEVRLAAAATAVDLAVACLGVSRSEARRLAEQGGVSADGRKLGPSERVPIDAREARVGKRGFFRIARVGAEGR
jgi:tyrosyl-tRNA synthetase